jgi:hypothetical protein
MSTSAKSPLRFRQAEPVASLSVDQAKHNATRELDRSDFSFSGLDVTASRPSLRWVLIHDGEWSDYDSLSEAQDAADWFAAHGKRFQLVGV